MQEIRLKTPGNTKPSIYNILLTCQSGLESLVRREGEKLGLQDTTGQDRIVSGSGDLSVVYRLLMGSRFANRVYIELTKETVRDFDQLYALLRPLPWDMYLSGREQIVIEASSTRSTLTSIPTIQSVGQKAIFGSLYTPNTTSGIEVHILILIIDDVARVLLDVTGDPLHKRGYRVESGEAPIKESLAAALLAFANWKYRTPLIDPCCGSGTIAIEAGMMARGMAPGLHRHFRIESLPFHDREIYKTVHTDLEKKIYPSGEYTILASDIDPKMVDIARKNAERAGVVSDIKFSVADALLSPISSDLSPTIVTNPPYDNRITTEDISSLYDHLEEMIEASRGGYITSIERSPGKDWKNKKLLNGREECRYWYRG